jgi:signal transduction histidine kinase
VTGASATLPRTRARSSFDLPRRVERAVQALAYLAIGLPLGLLGVLVLALVVVGALLSLVWIGLPLLLFALRLSRRLADVDRRQANRLLDAHLPPLGHRRLSSTDASWQRAVDALNDREQLRVLAMLALKLPVSLLLLVVAIAPLALTAWLLVLGVQGVFGVGETAYVGPLTLGVPAGLLLLALAPPAAILAIAVLGALRQLLAGMCRTLLGTRTQEGGPVRELLAESLGDRTLAIAYWLPDRGTFVDESGRQVDLPAPGSGRAWTAVERDGHRVAAIIHDAALDTGPELVNAAAAAAALALDNERLKADLRARVEELRVSRVRIVEAGDTARRRLERDLHDGAQQQLVALALDVRLLKARLRGAEVEPLVDELAEKLAVALAELRELARGIHPAILTDRGLAPGDRRARHPGLRARRDAGRRGRAALGAHRGRRLLRGGRGPDERRQVRAGHLRRRSRSGREGDAIHVEVSDDGRGGACLGKGSGLRGLVDRLAALDGTLGVDSPAGGGTVIRARVPCDPASLGSGAHERLRATSTRSGS